MYVCLYDIHICVHLPLAFPPPCLICIFVFGISGMTGTTGFIGRTGRSGGWTDQSIYFLSEWFHLQVFGRSLLHPWGLFCFHFGIILVVLGSVLATLGSPGLPKGGTVGKVSEKAVWGSFVGPPTGFNLEPKSTQNLEKVVPRSMLENTVRKVLQKRCLGPPSNHENDGFVYTRPSFFHFHLELQIKQKRCPKGTLLDPFGWFWEPLGTFLVDEKITAKLERSRGKPRPIWELHLCYVKIIPGWELEDRSND